MLAKNPVSLASALTKGKTSDKEKFDALFAWVATHIHYDYFSYFSSNGYGKPDIKQLLKHRYAICLGYASLMDTLCKLSGITNTTVYGYAKDEIFDVNDSLYIDNHAWNAVNLEGKWYVYDVTWASGSPEFELTKWSAFKYRLLTRATKRVKTKQKIFRTLVRSYCDPEIKIRTDTVVYYTYKLKDRVIINLLRGTKFKYKRVFTHKLNTGFYLCNPEKFAITHFPDDPRWALTAMHNARAFECDSAFYHLTDSTYKTQERYGRPCPDCDSYLGFKEPDKQQALKKASANCNPRNQFIAMLCNYSIGNIYFNESKQFDDSLSKITIIDTSLAYLDQAKENLKRSFTNIETDFELQRTKNRYKEDLLLNENVAHRDFIIRHKHLIKTQTASITNLNRSFRMNSNKLKRQVKRFFHLDTKETETHNVRNTEAKILELTHTLKRLDSVTLALDSSILHSKHHFETLHGILNKNVAFKIVQHDSVFGPFQKSTALRYYLKDNYKKSIVEVRKDINRNKLNYVKDLDEKIFSIASKWQDSGDSLFELITKHDKTGELVYKTKAELVRRGKLPQSVLKEYRDALVAKDKEDICWIIRNSFAFKKTFYLFAIFLEKQKAAHSIIETENKVEATRHEYVVRELYRRKRKYRKIVVNNTRVVTWQTRVVKKEKREFLKKLRRERREAAKKTK